jgi:sugar phosphate isomerase/epimerase
MNIDYARLTGIGDEGSPGILDQIENHRRLGWNTIELRNVDGKNVCEMNADDFDAVYGAMDTAGFTAAGFGSAIANWARPITMPFERDVEDLRRAAPRMHTLQTKCIRIMSYPNDKLPEPEWKGEVFKRLRELTRIAEGEGIILVHENCDGWGSKTPENLQELIATIDSPALRIVFDVGNPVGYGGDRNSTWSFYRAARPFIEHFHIKDCRPAEDGSIEHTMPGEGACDVEAIMRDLVESGYTGRFSIEPHIATQVHLGGAAAEGMDQRGIYLEYGNKANAIWKLIARVAE